MVKRIDKAIEAIEGMGPIGEPGGTPETTVDDDRRRRLIAWYTRRLAREGYDDRYGAATVLARYLAARREGMARKGLLLWGGRGRGKTAGVRIMARWLDAEFVTARDLVEDWIRDETGVVFRERYLTPPVYSTVDGEWVADLVIDDIGSEPVANRYGTRLDVIPSVVDAREAVWHRYGARLIVTINLTSDEVLERYGERALSRLRGMCYQAKLVGPDRRLDEEYDPMADGKRLE